MNPAQFRHRITFQRLVEGEDDGFGGGSYWEDVKTVWAAAKTLLGREIAVANATENIRRTRWIIRYTTGLDSDMRIIYGTRVFNITDIAQDDELRRTLTVVCEEVDPNANEN
jgi:SPP1 family predicted phage head-tail adaptor